MTVGPVAHGGHCVARHEGRVVFVRHALPGERVRAVVTEGHGTSSYWRADAVEVLDASPDRVDAAVPVGRPRPLRRLRPAARVASRAAASSRPRWCASRWRGSRASTVEVDVEEVPGAPDGLGWRTRVQWAVDADGRAGLRRHRSHEVVPVDGAGSRTTS